ncbi:pentapeptide repeat-containing protein [Prauserella cavernicola]|uniref:Pentapeptide repeat-containing protein n=1 Tax=Prauserella cavernicola TaxID=2800127 RepID=A0A934V555_9PSEU|nr:pentapeptide repeat-containing protein [Prauserella cavernicola]MBK1784810.1 pentapeptide repeat-containing protein [Prauserella cavernicola]
MKRLRSAFRSPLFGTIAAAVALVLGISLWLLTDSRTSSSDALRTGGLAGASVIALYALWLNDRRRKVEEARQDIERRRHDLETSRISDERFARSVELLGNEADQVRVGAMHALAGLARSRPGFTQTVLDVLCAYLRRPFSHPRFEKKPGAEDPEAERELQVRLTAQRLVFDLLPRTEQSGAPAYDLDLTGAALEYLDLSGRRMGSVILRYAYLHSSTNLSDCVFTGPAWFTATTTGAGRLAGRFRCTGTRFEERAWFSGTRFNSLADFTGTTFLGEANFKDAVFHGETRFGQTSFGSELVLRDARFDSHVDPPEGWVADELRDGMTVLSREEPAAG